MQVLRVRQIVEERRAAATRAIQELAVAIEPAVPGGTRLKIIASTPEIGWNAAECRASTTRSKVGAHEERHHERRDHRQNEDGVARVDLVALKSPRLDDEPAIQQHGDGGEHESREQLLRQQEQPVDGRGQHPVESERREHAAREDLDRAERQDDEAPEHRGVQHAGERFAENLRLTDPDDENVAKPRPGWSVRCSS